MKISPGDLADRLSILFLKSERLPEQSQREAVMPELKEVETACFASGVTLDEVRALVKENGAIWDLEAAIRQGKEGTIEVSRDVLMCQEHQLVVLAEVGRRALAIRELNGKRIALKNHINIARGAGFPEVKGNHASA